MVSLKAPKITGSQRKELETHKARLGSTIAEVQGDYKKVAELRKKEALLEKEAESLHRDAASFHREAEIKLAATLKQIERCHDAIHAAESDVFESKAPLFNIVDQAQEFVRQICQDTYNQLLDEIGAVLAPYYRSFHDARYAGRSAPAVNDLVIKLLGHGISPDNSIERMFEGARDTLRKVDVLLTGGAIWKYEEGAKVPSSKEAAVSAA
jgi:hypothetical protein